MNITMTTCCGCGACVQACPTKAIQLNKVSGGYLYPVIDQTLCIHCGLCEKVCGYQNAANQPQQAQTYVAVGTDVDLTASASGGLFASLAQAVVNSGGAVFGCAMVCEDGKLQPRHLCARSLEDLAPMKGSKYVQSDLGTAYPDAKKLLDDGVTVLFTGTPCQIAGLRSFLRRPYENLYTAEIICHGVPSAELFQAYLAMAEAQHGAKITGFRFRDKGDGWKLRGSMTLERNGVLETVSFEPEESSYYQMFLNGFTYRENCYSCPYASENRQGDVTLGDYWCIDLVHPELMEALDEKAGVSCLVCNNDHGKELVEHFGQGISLWPSTYAQASRYNAQLMRPVALRPERQKALELYQAGGYAAVEKWYQKRLRKHRFKRKLIAMIPMGIKDVLRPILKRNK